VIAKISNRYVMLKNRASCVHFLPSKIPHNYRNMTLCSSVGVERSRNTNLDSNHELIFEIFPQSLDVAVNFFTGSLFGKQSKSNRSCVAVAVVRERACMHAYLHDTWVVTPYLHINRKVSAEDL
jgi:hypothetical protein